VHQRPRLVAGRLGLKRVSVPVHEGEVEELRPRRRAQGQFPPEGVEGLAEAAFRRPGLHLEDSSRLTTYLALGELAHELGKAALAAVASVEGAHRHASVPGHLLGSDVAITV
jgi:hypothetical protein